MDQPLGKDTKDMETTLSISANNDITTQSAPPLQSTMGADTAYSNHGIIIPARDSMNASSIIVDTHSIEQPPQQLQQQQPQFTTTTANTTTIIITPIPTPTKAPVSLQQEHKRKADAEEIDTQDSKRKVGEEPKQEPEKNEQGQAEEPSGSEKGKFVTFMNISTNNNSDKITPQSAEQPLGVPNPNGTNVGDHTNDGPNTKAPEIEPAPQAQTEQQQGQGQDISANNHVIMEIDTKTEQKEPTAQPSNEQGGPSSSPQLNILGLNTQAEAALKLQIDGMLWMYRKKRGPNKKNANAAAAAAAAAATAAAGVANANTHENGSK